MYLSGLTHRDRLFDVATRWLADRLEPTDGRTVTEIFAFERAITAPTVRRFVADLCRTFHRGDLYMERITSKDEVRAAIVAAASHPSTRVAELIDWYRQLPEEFFPRTPVRMSLVTLRNGRLTAIVRRKRIRRIADKVSRRVAEQLTGEIVAVARALASSRPRPIAGADRDIAPPSTPAAVGGAAERLVADRIRSGRITLDPEKNRVDDVIGVKVIGTPTELEAIEASLDGLEYTFASQREVKAGTYEGVHYLVDLELPSNEAILANMAGIDWAFAAGRGLRVESLDERFRAYIESILEQRDLADDFGRIARNASSIIEYMLRLAISPTINIEQIPIKIWGRYIRDTLNYAIAELGEGEPTEWLVPEEHLEDLMKL
jgi:hypothetical protein